MKPVLAFCLCLTALPLAAQGNPPSSARAIGGYGNLPLSFEANQGQSDPQVKFVSRGVGYSLFLTSDEAVLALREGSGQEPGLPGAKSRTSPEKTAREKSAVLRIRLLGATARTEVTGQDELPGKSNYFIGNDPENWHTDVPQFAKVRYSNVYPGVDLLYYGHQRELEYDFVLQPGADPAQIRMGIEGATRLRLNHGELVLTNAGGDVHLRRPHIYQRASGVKQEVRGRYVITNKNEVGFEIAAYDRRRALVIDPVLAYSTVLGGSGTDKGNGIAVDSVGNAYVTGSTTSVDFPTLHPIRATPAGIFVTKFNADGSALVYSTYLGGSGSDVGVGIAVDAAGNAYLTGRTSSYDFPTFNAIQPTFGGSDDAFVTKINAAGSALVYSTYLGGSGADFGNSIAVDRSGNTYVVGRTNSTDFPTAKAIQATYHGGQADVFVTKINASGSAFVYSTFLGGSSDDYGYGIAADATGNAYVTGWTTSTDFPTAKAIQPNYGGGNSDAFVTKINAEGSALVYSTYLGGSDGDGGLGIALDSSRNTYVTGWAFSPNFPIVNAVEPLCCGGAFVTKVKADGSAFVYSTFLNTFQHTYSQGSSIAVDRAGNAYIAGYSAGGFTTVNAVQPTKACCGSAAFVSKLSADDSAFVYSTYLGGKPNDFGQGVATDAAGSAYVVGYTNRLPVPPAFPATPAAFQQSLKGSSGVFVAKIAQQTFINLSRAKLAYSTHVIGLTSAATNVAVTNQGSTTLTIHKIFIGGLDADDFAQTNTCAATLAPSTSCTVSVTFTPGAKGPRSAALAISTPDPGSPDAILLNGTGTVVSLSQSQLVFGDEVVGTSSVPQSVTLTNTGSTPLNFKSLGITGANAGDYSLTTSCSGSVAAKAGCTITVTFKPTATGPRRAAVSISDDGGANSEAVHLVGRGT